MIRQMSDENYRQAKMLIAWEIIKPLLPNVGPKDAWPMNEFYDVLVYHLKRTNGIIDAIFGEVKKDG